MNVAFKQHGCTHIYWTKQWQYELFNILRGKKWPAHYSKAYSNRSDRQIWLYNMSFVIICQIDSTFRWGFWQWWQQTHTPPFPKSAIWSVWITSQNEWGKNIRSFSRLKISIRLTMSIISIQRKWLSLMFGSGENQKQQELHEINDHFELPRNEHLYEEDNWNVITGTFSRQLS